MSYQNIPAEMRARKQWVCYRVESNPAKPGKKPQKVPYQISGANASSTNPATWATFEAACAAVAAKKFPGISYALGWQDNLVCVDLDDARNPETGEPAPWAAEIIGALGSYTEVSPSGTGFHIFVKGTIPKASHKGKVELYARDKIMATSGDLAFSGGCDTVRECPAELAAVFQRAEAGEWGGAKQEPAAQQPQAKAAGGSDSEADYALIGKTFRKLNTRDVAAIDADIKANHPEIYLSRNRQKKSHNGYPYFWYSIVRFLERNPPDAAAATQEPTTAATPPGELDTIRAANVPLEIIHWLWKNRLPIGEVSIFSGLPDCGKTTVSLAVASCVTQGSAFPNDCDNELGGPKNVIMLVSEDSLGATVVPRLCAAGADLNRVLFIKAVKIPEGGKSEERMLAFDTDIEKVETEIKRDTDVRLLIVDPLASYLGKAKKNAEEDLRTILVKLKQMAERCGIAILLLDHFNKNTLQAAIHRMSGTQAMSAVPRAVWQFFKEEIDEEAEEDSGPQKYMMLCAKLNIVKEEDKRGMIYSIRSAEVEIHGQTTSQPAIEWHGTTAETPDKMLRKKEKQQANPEDIKTRKAIDFLKTALSEGPQQSRKMYEELESMGIGKRTAERARNMLKILSTRRDEKWWMELPNATQTVLPIIMADNGNEMSQY